VLRAIERTSELTNEMPEYFPRGQLDALALQYGTDKASSNHDYMRFYEFFLNRFRNDEFVLLELGVGPQENKGKSLLTWRDYFPKAKIVGVDIRRDAKDVETDRVTVEIGDCSDVQFLKRLGLKYLPTIIIDDASHKWSHQVKSLETLFPILQPGGVFIMEDLHTSFGKRRETGFADQADDAFSYLARQTHLLTGCGHAHPGAGPTPPPNPVVKKLRGQIDAICFYARTAILIKRPAVAPPKSVGPA
jgi:hypothetical protein